jgi:2-polyprenyl-6-methoxyphenol hydroxylase-like FAD-dependent oxidoreductase
VAIAFTIERVDGQPFTFDSVTYYPASIDTGSMDTGIDYATFFPIRHSPIGQAMRVNLFAFPGVQDAWARRFLEELAEELRQCFPKLEEAIGAYRVAGKIETSLIHLYRTEGDVQPGIVLIGDAAQNACPSTGMGLSKVFTDVDVLCTECVPEWFASPGMSSEKTASFWNNPRKRATDAKAIQDAVYRRKARTESSLRWKIHRARLEFAMRFGWKRKLAANNHTSGTPPQRNGQM